MIDIFTVIVHIVLYAILLLLIYAFYDLIRFVTTGKPIKSKEVATKEKNY